MGLHGIGGLLTLGRPGTQGGGATFSPEDVSGLLLDVNPALDTYQDDAGTTPATTDGAVVGRIVDQHASISFIQPGAAKPLLKTGANGMNGKPVLRFAGAEWLRADNVLTSGETGTIFAVFRPNLLDGTRYLLTTSDEASTSYRWMFAGVDAAASRRIQVLQTSADTFDKVSGATALTTDTNYIAMLRSDNLEYQLRLNGAMENPAVVGGANTGDWWSDTPNRDNVVIGAIQHTSTGQYYSGDIARLLVYDSALSGADILQIEAYLSQEYGIAVATEGIEYSTVLITFDDSHASVYDPGYTYAATKGVSATFYLNSGNVGATGEDVTWEQLAIMYGGGWDIGNHTENHVDLDTSNEALITSELGNCTAALDAHGLTRASLHVSYPHGRYNTTTLSVMAALGMLTGRRADQTGAFALSSPPPAYELETVYTAREGFDASDIFSQIFYYNQVYIYLFHRIAPVTESLTVATAEWQEFVDALAASHLNVLTISELYDALYT